MHNDMKSALMKYAELIGFVIDEYEWGFEVRAKNFNCGGIIIENHKSELSYVERYRVFTKRRDTGISEAAELYRPSEGSSVRRWLDRLFATQN